MSRVKPISERAAKDDIARVYHEIRQTLRIDGVNLLFRILAAQGSSLPFLWDKMKANAKSIEFERLADELRHQAVQQLRDFAPLSASSKTNLGPSQIYRLRKAIDTYRYITPKLLLWTTSIRRAMTGEFHPISKKDETDQAMILGIPPTMFPMEMVSEQPDNIDLNQAFEDIRKTLGTPRVNSYFRTFALWPEYLKTYWQSLRQLVNSAEYSSLLTEVQELSFKKVEELPYQMSLMPEEFEQHKADFQEILEHMHSFERIIAMAVLNVNLAGRDLMNEEDLSISPFPATRGGPNHGLAIL